MKHYIFTLFALCAFSQAIYSTSHTTFVPLQLTYDPVFEQANYLHYLHDNDNVNSYFSIRINFFAQQSLQNNLDTFFTLNNKKSLSIIENGNGDADALWFQVIAADDTEYLSTVSLNPERLTIGGIITGNIDLHGIWEHLFFNVHTMLVHAKHNMKLKETNISTQGTVPGILTVTQSLDNPNRLFAKMSNTNISKTGLDDIQCKLVKEVIFDNSSIGPYFLIGLPTGKGTTAQYAFEPIIGSNHLNFGLGSTFHYNFANTNSFEINLLGEVKWHYALAANETRTFDLTQNGDWSRYLLVVKEPTKSITEFASNYTTLNAQVTPGNNAHLLVGVHFEKEKFALEVGYGFNYKQAETIKLLDAYHVQDNIAIADLPGIAALTPVSASTAKINETITGSNAMTSDTTFITIKQTDFDITSAAQPMTYSNKIYIGFTYDTQHEAYPLYFSLNVSGEFGKKATALTQTAIWFGANLLF